MKFCLKKIALTTTVIVGLITLFSFPAQAYLDAGTGSMLLQGLFGGIVAGMVIMKAYWAKLKLFTHNLFSSNTDTSESDDTSEQKDNQ